VTSSHSKSEKDDLILHRALDSRLLKAIEFASIVAELAELDISADEYLVKNGYIDEDQRQRLIETLNDLDQNDATQVGWNGPTVRDATPSSNSERLSAIPTSLVPPAETPRPKSGVSRYKWIEKFAEGGLGAVWHARDLTVDRHVALKEILPKAKKHAATVERFLEEARITGQLQHPSVVPIYDMGTDKEVSPFYIMKFVEGQTMHVEISKYHVRKRQRRMPTTSCGIC